MFWPPRPRRAGSSVEERVCFFFFGFFGLFFFQATFQEMEESRDEEPIVPFEPAQALSRPVACGVSLVVQAFV